MPANYNLPQEGMLYQRDQYKKSFLARFFWDFRDRAVLVNIPQESKVILDLGCGEGITLERLVRGFTSSFVLGLDLCPENITICKEHHLRAIYSDLTQVPVQDGSADCCLLLEVIEHLPQPERVLAEAARVLKKGGRIYIIFPNDLVCLLARLVTFKIKEAFYDSGHLIQWTPALLKKALSHAGFSPVKQKSLPFNTWPLAISCLMVAKKD